MTWRQLIFACSAFAYLLSPQAADAAMLHFLSDLLSTSRPATSTNHTITFRVTSAIPAGGSIIITPQANSFDIPATLDFGDVDFATSSALLGPFNDRTLASSSSAVADGVSVVSGVNGSLVIGLNSTAGIGANTFIQIEIGNHALSGESGSVQIVNPSSTGSYYIYVETRDASNVLLDGFNTHVGIVSPVSMQADTFDFAPPVISNGLPAGTIPGGITQVQMSVNTDETALCKYATSSGVSYAAMTSEFGASSSTLHFQFISGLTDNTTYNFYVRCADRVNNQNSSDYVVSFTVGVIQPPPDPGSGGGSPGGGGLEFPPVTSSIDLTLSGKTIPAANIFILKDGVVFRELQASGNGDFETTATDLVQGAHTFLVYAKDSSNRRTSSYSATLSLISGTKNRISGIVLSPTLGFIEERVDPGNPLTIEGKAAPLATIDVEFHPQKKGTVFESEIVRGRTTSTSNGSWEITFETEDLEIGTYEAFAVATVADIGESQESVRGYFGIGQDPTPDPGLRADLNKDGKVNLIDFSILLFHWGTDNPEADISQDGKINLTDFSIMLFAWTG